MAFSMQTMMALGKKGLPYRRRGCFCDSCDWAFPSSLFVEEQRTTTGFRSARDCRWSLSTRHNLSSPRASNSANHLSQATCTSDRGVSASTMLEKTWSSTWAIIGSTIPLDDSLLESKSWTCLLPHLPRRCSNIKSKSLYRLVNRSQFKWVTGMYVHIFCLGAWKRFWDYLWVFFCSYQHLLTNATVQ